MEQISLDDYMHKKNLIRKLKEALDRIEGEEYVSEEEFFKE